MDPYQKDLLERIAKETSENNKILRGLRSNARWGTFFSLLKWAIILTPIIWAYIYFQPYFGTIRQLLDKVPEQIKTLETLQNQVDSAKNILNSIPTKIQQQ